MSVDLKCTYLFLFLLVVAFGDWPPHATPGAELDQAADVFNLQERKIKWLRCRLVARKNPLVSLFLLTTSFRRRFLFHYL